MKNTDWLKLIGLAVLWGGTFFFQSLSLRIWPTFTIVFFRVFFAAAVFWLIVLVSRQSMPRERHVWLAFLVMGLINNAIPFTLITWEQTHVEGGIASIINATASCFAVVFAHFLTRDEKLTFSRAIGVMVGLAGAYVLLRPELDGGITARGLGEMAGLVAAMSLALAGIFGKRFRNQTPVVTATGMLTCSSLLMLPLVLVFDRPWTLDVAVVSMAPIAGLVLLSTVLAYLLYFSILRSAGATNLLLVTLLMPVTAHILGAAFLDEPLYISSVVGMLFVVAGLSIIDGRVLRWLRRMKSPDGGMPDEGTA